MTEMGLLLSLNVLLPDIPKLTFWDILHLPYFDNLGCTLDVQ